MADIDIKKTISMTELQKLSLKQLRRRGTPLFVLDRRSNEGGFVILDLSAYERLRHIGEGGLSVSEPSFEGVDFRARGLLWDRSDITNEMFALMLKDPSHPEHFWALKRVMEYAPSRDVTSWLSLGVLREALSGIRLRPPFQEAWEHAVHYWTEHS